MLRRIVLALASLVLVSGTATAGMNKSVVDIAAGDDRFETLVQAVQAADLAETLSGEGPFTVFAPTDEAFANLPEGTVENLLKPENRDQLRAILTYHVVPEEVPSSAIAGKTLQADTVNGKPLGIDASGGGVEVGNANVVAADVSASNGVIHVVDTVIMPPES
ncbi:Nex18 symbiotically induced protein [Rhodovibrio sodomensis]|uniref:Nex18 symbiotically induced protein n=2 Tax=Rhodovibrio sodomensis TaxID=1088 RepID=A0ABS1DEZ6_9PROT|nr:Nex18 symbiotically induced protein [Rhodovibrio sodomensis]